MKQATFFEGVAIALLSSITGAVIFITLSSVFFGGDVFRLIVAGLSFCYMLYLFTRSQERVGRVTVILAWFIVTLASVIFVPSLLLYIVIQLAMIWLIRSLYFYNSVLSSLADFGLTGMSLMIAIWVWSITHSLFLGFWCFFLAQAMFVFIPQKITGKKEELSINRINDDQFERAFHAAETAVAKLIKTH